MTLEAEAQRLCTDLVVGVEQTARGHLCLKTALRYPDGSHIDVFLQQDTQLRLGDTRVLSDLGQTAAWLLDLRIKPWLSKSRQRLLDDALEGLGARWRQGCIEIELPPGEALGPAVLRLAQACLRAADLIFTQRSSIATSSKDKLEDFLTMRDLTFDADVELVGRHQRKVRVDYRVEGPTHASLVLVLGSAHPSSAHALATEIFSRWYDLSETPWARHRVTVFDDTTQLREADLDRLGEISQVVALHDEVTLTEALAA